MSKLFDTEMVVVDERYFDLYKFMFMDSCLISNAMNCTFPPDEVNIPSLPTTVT